MTRELNAWINRLNTRLTNVTNHGNKVLLIKYVAIDVHFSWLGSEFWPTWFIRCMVSKFIIQGYSCSHGNENLNLLVRIKFLNLYLYSFK